MHEDHRERVRAKYIADGLDNWPEHNVLELLLFYCIPRKDTNPLAHTLINEFGSLAGVLDADPEKLMRVKGIGENAAVFLNMIPRIMKMYVNAKVNEKALFLSSRDDVTDFITNQFLGSTKEEFMIFCFDGNGKYIGCSKFSTGSIDNVRFSKREALDMALSKSARGVILAHNHPGFVASPSNEDIQATVELINAFSAVSISVHDHIIVSETSTISMYDIEKLRPIFSN